MAGRIKEKITHRKRSRAGFPTIDNSQRKVLPLEGASTLPYGILVTLPAFLIPLFLSL